MSFTEHEKFLVSHGIDHELVEKAHEAGVKLVLTMYQIKFAYGGEVLAKVASPGGSWHKHPQFIGNLKPQIEAAIQQALAAADGETPAKIMDEGVLENKLFGSSTGKSSTLNPNMQQLPKKANPVPPAPEISKAEDGMIPKFDDAPLVEKDFDALGFGSVPVCDTKEIASGASVLLANASKMYQPVKSTSGGSKYHTIGIGQNLRVAARYKSKTLSIRIEADDTDTFQSLKKVIEKSAAFKPGYASVKANYASMHMTVPQTDLADMAMAAVLSAMPDTFKTPLPTTAFFAAHGV
jgi:hypothetical protein